MHEDRLRRSPSPGKDGLRDGMSYLSRPKPRQMGLYGQWNRNRIPGVVYTNEHRSRPIPAGAPPGGEPRGWKSWTTPGRWVTERTRHRSACSRCPPMRPTRPASHTASCLVPVGAIRPRIRQDVSPCEVPTPVVPRRSYAVTLRLLRLGRDDST